MCRWLAYKGRPIYLEDLLYTPDHSLIDQSLNARESKTGTNGDGFGIGWYGGRNRPGVFREVLPAWNDSNLRSLAHQISSSSFFAHVRASTGTATSRPNCHPFSHGRWMFMHNGQIGGYTKVRRQLENQIPDDLYQYRLGTTDSELIFLMMLAEGLEDDSVSAIAKTLSKVDQVAADAGVDAAFRFTSSITDGENLYAVRYSSDPHPPTLYYSLKDEELVVVSEPLDTSETGWTEVPGGKVLVSNGSGLRFEDLAAR